MILGCDLGTGFAKAVLMEDNAIKYHTVIPTEANPDKTMEKVLADLRENQKLKLSDISETVITGWGKEKVTIDHVNANLLNCIAKAVIWANPNCRSVLHLGAQQSIALSVNDQGRVVEFRINDKCAAGSGKFLEVISAALEINMKDISDIMMMADKDLVMSSQCAVFGESEVVSKVNDGESVANIIAAVVRSLGRSIATMAKRANIGKGCIISGGPAKIKALVDYLEDLMKIEIKVFQPAPDIIAALGAALLAKGGK